MSLSTEEIIVKSQLFDEETYGFQSLVTTMNITNDECLWCNGTTLMWDNAPCICLDYEELIHIED